jgi:hypothetical protein
MKLGVKLRQYVPTFTATQVSNNAYGEHRPQFLIFRAYNYNHRPMTQYTYNVTFDEPSCPVLVRIIGRMQQVNTLTL